MTPTGSEGSAGCVMLVPAAQGLDIGPESLKAFQAALAGARTVLWNGPMGVFEWPRFAAGTIGIAHALAELTDKVRSLHACAWRWEILLLLFSIVVLGLKNH